MVRRRVNSLSQALLTTLCSTPVVAALRAELARAKDDLTKARTHIASLEAPRSGTPSQIPVRTRRPSTPHSSVKPPMVFGPTSPTSPAAPSHSTNTYQAKTRNGRQMSTSSAKGVGAGVGGRYGTGTAGRTESMTSDGSGATATEGLSIRIVSTSGSLPVRTPKSSTGASSMGIRSSPSSRIPPTASPSLPSSSSPAFDKGVSRIPVSAVSFGRVLAGDTSPRMASLTSEPEVVDDGYLSPPMESSSQIGGEEDAAPAEANASESGSVRVLPRRRIPLVRSVTPSEHPASMIPRPLSPGAGALMTSPTLNGTGGGRSSRNNPFFSSGGGRDRGAMIHGGASTGGAGGGGTGKVITALQSDLIYARSALDQSKSQLRLNQRATESLTRQVDDLRESMARLRLENEGLSKMLGRKERTVSELMERVKKAEGELGTLRTDKKELETGLKRLTKESDEQVKEANRKKERAEAGYEAVRSGVKGLQEGWSREVEALRKEIGALQEKHRKDLDENKLKYQTRASPPL